VGPVTMQLNFFIARNYLQGPRIGIMEQLQEGTPRFSTALG